MVTTTDRDIHTEAATPVRLAGRGAGGTRTFWRSNRVRALGLQLAFLVVLAGSWQASVDAGLIKPLFVSKPSSILSALYTLLVHGSLLSALGTTLFETAGGFLISVVTGVLSALVLLEFPLIQRAASPYITAANNLPRLALAPLFVLWFGIGAEERIILIITMVYFVILISTYAGLQNADRDQLILARALGASRWQTFTRFRLPSALPTMFGGFQLGMTYSFMGAVISELLAGGSGLGALLSSYQASYDTADTFADLLLMAVIATILASIMKMIERTALRWRRYELRGLDKS